MTHQTPSSTLVTPTIDRHTLYLAGGCFWGLEAFFQQLPGVRKTVAGYANGLTTNPSYHDVCHNNTGHAETIAVTYDRRIIPTEILLDAFFEVVDPTTENCQGNDFGIQYRSGIYWDDANDQPVIDSAMNRLQKKYSAPVATEVKALEGFYPAEEYHQSYLEKNPGGYCHINLRSAGDFALSRGLIEGMPYALETNPTNSSLLNTTASAISYNLESQEKPESSEARETIDKLIIAKGYSAPNDETLSQLIDENQFRIVRENATERPFSSEYDHLFEHGIYVDITSGEPLFASADKFNSGCGWPSFSRPITKGVVAEYLDKSLGSFRTEVRSRAGSAHLGHVFTDGPSDEGGLRYCINGGALRFVPYEKMDEEGYAYLKPLVKTPTKEV